MIDYPLADAVCTNLKEAAQWIIQDSKNSLTVWCIVGYKESVGISHDRRTIIRIYSSRK